MKVSKLITVGLTLMASFAVSGAFSTNPALAETLVLQKLPANIHAFTGLPLTEEGWTDFRHMIQEQGRYQDARVIFVSSSEGNDATGTIYGINNITFDANGMFQPTGTVNAFQTIAAAYSNIVSGSPDILLLKRGDEWSERFTTTGVGRVKSGRSMTERHIIASYGAGERPQLFESAIDARDSSYIVISGLRLYTNDYKTAGRAIDITGAVDHQLYEDLWVDQHLNNKIQGGSDGISNVAIRRSIFTDHNAWDGAFYVARITNMLFEENVFSKPRRPEDDTRYARHFYLSPSGLTSDDKNALIGLVLRRNILYAGERESIDIRSGGVVENNLSLQNDITIVGGRGGSEDSIQTLQFTNNVYLEGTPNTNDPNRLELINIDGGMVSGNIWTDNSNLASSVNVISITGSVNVNLAKDIEISDNIIYGFSGPTSGRAFSVSATLEEVENLTIKSNDFQYIYGSQEIILHREWQVDRFEGFSYSNNRYYSPIAESGWFIPGGTLAGWIAESGETGAQAVAVSYSDPLRNIKTYHQSLGGAADTEAFMSEVIQQSRHNWRPAYTACAANNYIREGFDKDPVECTFQ